MLLYFQKHKYKTPTILNLNTTKVSFISKSYFTEIKMQILKLSHRDSFYPFF